MAGIRETIAIILSDCFTSKTGEYDPARLIGYGLVALGAIEFMVLTAYVTFKDGKFEGMQFCAGLASIGTALVAAAGGVWIKRSAENDPK